MSAMTVIAPWRAAANSGKRVLVVDDEAAMRSALEVNFRRRGWQVETALGKSDALARLRQRRPELVVTDVRMPGGDGFEVLRTVQEMSRDTPPGMPHATAVILLTGFASVPDAVAAMKAGACEYLMKPVTFEQLMEAAERVLRPRAQERDPQKEKNEKNWEMVGSSPVLLGALERARRAARSDADVLIQAESGTGKELLARMIHSLSARSEGPLIAINCAGFPESLLESELFGHGRGAFTGAVGAQPGKFELANGGTLLLDEIGEMPLNLQPKLLRALQEREFYRLGEPRPVKVDIRVISTTNRDLAAMVREGTFRADLYYRLNVIPLALPPLRERVEDVGELALHFARVYSPRDEVTPKLSEGLLSQLEHHAWPGNVRELANFIRRTIALDGESTPLAEWTGSELAEISPALALEHGGHGPSSSLQPGMSLDSMQRQLLAMTLDATAGNRSRAAEMLGVSLRTVRNKIREYNLPPRREYVQLHD